MSEIARVPIFILSRNQLVADLLSFKFMSDRAYLVRLATTQEEYIESYIREYIGRLTLQERLIPIILILHVTSPEEFDYELIIKQWKEWFGTLKIVGVGNAHTFMRLPSNLKLNKVCLEKAGLKALLSEVNKAAGVTSATRDVSEFNFTKREIEVGRLIAQGMSNREIGDALSLETQSIGRYISRMFEKSGFTNRTQIAAVFMGV